MINGSIHPVGIQGGMLRFSDPNWMKSFTMHRENQTCRLCVAMLKVMQPWRTAWPGHWPIALARALAVCTRHQLAKEAGLGRFQTIAIGC